MSTQIVLAAKHQTSESTISNDASDSIALHVASQKEYFQSEVTKSIEFRIQQLRRLKKLIRQYEDDLLEALHKDLGRSHMESYMSEFMLVINEINYSIKKLKNWAKPKFVDNNFFLKPAKSKIYYEPFGVCLILSPWNFPVLLSIRPIISALSAGNCVTLKCSEATPHVNDIMKTMINEHFPQEYLD
ncbi:MAG: aldehyde dehydrogenase family protein, partial [Candidatus Berkiella sp.]